MIAGAHWVVPPARGARIAMAYQGPVAPEADAAFDELQRGGAGGRAARDHLPGSAARRLAGCAAGAASRGARRDVAYRDVAGAAGTWGGVGHGARRPPCDACLAGRVRGQRVVPLGPDHFGQSGDIPDLYREYGIDTDAILDACAQALLAA